MDPVRTTIPLASALVERIEEVLHLPQPVIAAEHHRHLNIQEEEGEEGVVVRDRILLRQMVEGDVDQVAVGVDPEVDRHG